MLFMRIFLPLVATLLPFSATAAILKEITGGIVPENEDGSLPLFQLGPASAAIPSRALNARAVPVEHGRPAPDGCAAPARRPVTSDEITTPTPDPDSGDGLPVVPRPTQARGGPGARRPRPTPSDNRPISSDDPTSTTPEPKRPTPADDDEDDIVESGEAAPEPTEDSECSDSRGSFLNGMLDPVPGPGRSC